MADGVAPVADASDSPARVAQGWARLLQSRTVWGPESVDVLARVVVHLDLWPVGHALRLLHPDGRIEEFEAAVPGYRSLWVQLPPEEVSAGRPGDTCVRAMLEALTRAGRIVPSAAGLRRLAAARLMAAVGRLPGQDALTRSLMRQPLPACPSGQVADAAREGTLQWWPGGRDEQLAADLRRLCGDWRLDDALRLVREAQLAGGALGARERLWLIDALGHGGRLEQMRAQVNAWQRTGDPAARQIRVFRSLIVHAASLGQLDVAEQSLRDLRASGLVPDAECFFALIEACDRRGELSRSQALVEDSLRRREGVFQPGLGLSGRRRLDFHASALLFSTTTGRSDEHQRRMPAALAEVVLEIHRAAGRLTPRTVFVTGQHGRGAVRARVWRWLLGRGWMPAVLREGRATENPGCLVVRRVVERGVVERGDSSSRPAVPLPGRRRTEVRLAYSVEPASAPWLKPPST